MDNFDLKKYLIENKATTNSRMLNEEQTTVDALAKYYITLLKAKYPKNLVKLIADYVADSMNGIPEPKSESDLMNWAKSDIQWNASEEGIDEKDIDKNYIQALVAGVEDTIPSDSKMMKEQEGKKKPEKISKVEFPNGKTFEEGGEDEEGNIVIFIHKYPTGYSVSGQEYDWDNDEYGDEAYTYWYDLKGNESSENDIVTTDYAY